MTAFDNGTQALIDDLHAQPPSFGRDEILGRVRRLLYHSFKSPYAAPECVLVKHLTLAGFPALAKRVIDGRYEQPPAESQKWAEQTREGRQFSEAALAEPEMRQALDQLLHKAKANEERIASWLLQCIRNKDFRHPVFHDKASRKTEH